MHYLDVAAEIERLDALEELENEDEEDIDEKIEPFISGTDRDTINLSKRDLRKFKNREKMAGGFRKDSGHKMYCTIMTMIETFKKRGIAIFEGIKQIFNGTLVIN